MKTGMLILCSVAAAVSIGGQVVDYRHSADYSQQVIYITTNVAVSKTIVQHALDEVRVVYSIWKGRPGMPEFVFHTGDVIDLQISSNPDKLGVSEDKKWLVVISREFDERKGDYTRTHCVVSLVSGDRHSAASLAALERELKEPGKFTTLKMEPVELFFDRLLITYFESKVRK